MEKEEQKVLEWSDFRNSLGFVFGYVMENRREGVAVLLLALLSAAMGAVVPYAVGRFIDGLIELSKGEPSSLWFWALIGWFVIVLASTLLDWRLEVRSRRMGSYIHALALSRWHSALLSLTMAFHKDRKAGTVGSKINRGSVHMATLIEKIILGTGPQVLSMFIGLAFAYTLQPALTAIMVVGTIIYGFILIKTALPLAQLQSENNKVWGEAHGIASDAIGNIQTVKQSTAEILKEHEIRKNFISGVFEAQMKPEMVWVKIRFFQDIAAVTTRLGVFVGAVYFVAQGSLSVGELVALSGYSAMIFGPLANIAMNWNTIQNGLTMVHDVQEILGHEKEAYEREDAVVPSEWKGNIAFNTVNFAYPDSSERTVLNDVSFDIKDGETVAFVGESGVGKSTAIELIGGYYYPTLGEVLVSGVPTSKLSLRPLRERIAVVPQEPVLFNDTVISNIRFGRATATDEDVVEAAKKAYAHEFIETFPEKYNQLVGERGVKLSVGQKQRIAIARAILRDPRILILDEPTSALDAKTESQITTSLEELMRGRTTIIIAHRLSTVRKADNIIVFEGGKVVEQGKHADLIAKENGVYRKLYEYQIGLHA